MKTLVLAGFTCTLCLASFAAERPTNISDEMFVKQLTAAVTKAETKNPQAVELLGWGTALLLDSHRESKIRCGRGNPNPKPGECSDAYPIYPEPKPLAVVIANEQEKVKASTTETVWVAWCDLNGMNIAFNSPKLGDYELSTVTEVNQDGRWTAVRCYYTSVKYGEKQWENGPEISGAGFTWLTVGNTADIIKRLQALQDIGVSTNIISNQASQYYKVWESIPNDLTPPQQEALTQFNQQAWTQENLDELGIKFVNLFPWINLQELSIRDKVFLVQTAKELAGPVKWALLK